MSAQIFSFLCPQPQLRDWSTQELAEFYRVESALVQAGLRVISGRGVTDEGDPWFVFCRAEDDEVIIHFARIRGSYLLSAPAYCGTAMGRDFQALVRDMMERHPVLRPRSGRDNLFLHPAAILIVLVTSAFLKAGHAANAAPVKTSDSATGGKPGAAAPMEATAAPDKLQHEAIILSGVTSIALVATAAPVKLVAFASVHLPYSVDQIPVHSSGQDLLGTSAFTLSHGSGSTTPPIGVLISPPTPVIDIFHPASVRVQSQPIVTEIAGSSDPSGFHHDSLPPTEAFGQLVPVSSHSTGSAAALVPLLSLSSIPKADLDLLHALKTPDNVPYLVDLPASLSTKLQTGVHSDVVHTDASQTASTVPISQTPTTVIASNAPAPQISPAEATATTPSAHSASSGTDDRYGIRACGRPAISERCRSAGFGGNRSRGDFLRRGGHELSLWRGNLRYL